MSEKEHVKDNLNFPVWFTVMLKTVKVFQKLNKFLQLYILES